MLFRELRGELRREPKSAKSYPRACRPRRGGDTGAPRRRFVAGRLQVELVPSPRRRRRRPSRRRPHLCCREAGTRVGMIVVSSDCSQARATQCNLGPSLLPRMGFVFCTKARSLASVYTSSQIARASLPAATALHISQAALGCYCHRTATARPNVTPLVLSEQLAAARGNASIRRRKGRRRIGSSHCSATHALHARKATRHRWTRTTKRRRRTRRTRNRSGLADWGDPTDDAPRPAWRCSSTDRRQASRAKPAAAD